jgi:hypothetical protein
MTETFDKLVLVVAIAILIPVLLTPAGWIFAITVAVIWILLAYGIRYLAGLEKARRTGERGRIAEVRSRAKDRGRDR